MRLLWAAEHQESGGFYGYSIHSRKLKEALVAAGVTIVHDPQEPADFAVHVVPPDEFSPLEGRRNLLFTTCETSPLRVAFRNPRIHVAALLVVPSKFCVREFTRFYPDVPIRRCPLGIDPAEFPYCERTPPRKGEPFVYLWLGSVANNRKGYDIVNDAWHRWMASSIATTGRTPGGVLLYIKTTGAPGVEGIQRFKMIVQNKRVAFDAAEKWPSVPDLPGIVLDNRDLPPEQLLNLYRSAHMFLIPSRAEGFGLTLCEALSTGLPSSWTAWSGMRDFALEAGGFPLTKYKIVQNKLAESEEFFALADSAQLVSRMGEVLDDYRRAVERAKKASAHVQAHFRWSDSAATFMEIVENAVREEE